MKAISRRNMIMAGLAGAVSAPAMAVPAGASAKWDEEHDFVVIGAGGAGLSAACAAVEKGLDTLVLEKMAFPGGSSLICTSMYAVAGTDMQKKQGVKDTDEIFFDDMIKNGEKFNEPALVRAFVRAVKNQYEWMTGTLGVKPRELALGAGMSQPRGHVFSAQEVINAMLAYAKKGGAKVRCSTPARHLIWDFATHRVCGVVAVEKGGTEIRIRAKKGVLISTGGFARSPEILAKYNPWLRTCEVLSAQGTTGDGLLMAQELGADIRDTAFIKATYGAKPKIRSAADQTTVYYSGAIMVNRDGKRFVNEEETYMTLSDAALKQPEGKSYLVFDSAILETCLKEPQGRELFEMIPKGTVPDYVFAGNSLAEVAKKAGLPVKVLEETVSKYNADVAKGADSAFGRKSLVSGFGKPVPIGKGPFYVFPSSSVIFGTYCGIRIDEKARAVDVFGRVIPGLFAAGETTGGIHGANYMSGSGYAKALGFGRLAALSVAAGV